MVVPKCEERRNGPYRETEENIEPVVLEVEPSRGGDKYRDKKRYDGYDKEIQRRSCGPPPHGQYSVVPWRTAYRRVRDVSWTRISEGGPCWRPGGEGRKVQIALLTVVYCEKGDRNGKFTREE